MKPPSPLRPAPEPDPSSSGRHSPLPPEVVDAPADARFGKFVRTVKLGAGGMGEVWKAWDLGLSRWVALKFLRGGDTEEVQRFLREAQLAGSLMHPNIAAIYEVGSSQGRHFIAMQFIEGRTLKAVGHGDPRRMARLVRDAAMAVAFAHGRGIVHRDLKPENLMVMAGPGRSTTRGGGGHVEDQLYVMDFGLARAAEGASELSVSGLIVGTPGYMSPEQSRGERVDARSDVFSLGATLYELVTGRPPFRGANVFETLSNVQGKDPPPPRQLDTKIDPDLETILIKSLEKSRERRYRSMNDLAADLDRYLNGEPILARRASMSRRLRLWTRRNRGLATTALAGTLGVLLTAGWAFWLGPAWKASARRTRLESLEARARTALDAERARLAAAPPDEVIRQAGRDAVAARIRSQVPAADDEERAAVDRALAGYAPGPLLSRAWYEKGDPSMAFRFDPDGTHGLRGQREIARRFAAERRYDEAAFILRRIRQRPEAEGASADLASVLAELGDLDGAAAAFAEAGGVPPLASLLEAIGEERQSVTLPPSAPRGVAAWKEPLSLLDLDGVPTLVLPWREGRPAYEIRQGRLEPGTSPVVGLEATDVVVAVAAADLDGDGKQDVVAAVHRPGTGGGYAWFSRPAGRWELRGSRLDNPTIPLGLAVADLDADGKPEAAIVFKYESSVQWIVRFPEGRVVHFTPPGARAWSFAPLAGDFDGDGSVELLLGRSMQLEASVEAYRFRKGDRVEPLGSHVVGEPIDAVAGPDGLLAFNVDVSPEFLVGRVAEALQGSADDALVILRYRGGRFEPVARHPITRGDTTNCQPGTVAFGRFGGRPVIVAMATRGAPEPEQRRAEGQRFRVLVDDPTRAPISFAPRRPVDGFTLRDLDGDGDSELLATEGGQLRVYGRRTRPVPPLAPPPVVVSRPGEAAAMMQGAQDLLGFESYDAARDLLAEIGRRFPGSPEATEAEPLRVEALLRRATLDLAAAEIRFQAAKPADAERLLAEALDRHRLAAREALEASVRTGERSARRRLLELSAEACRRAGDWDLYVAARQGAVAAAPKPGDEGALDRWYLGQVSTRTVLQGDLADEANRFQALLPSRVSRRGDAVVLQFDSHSIPHAAGVPFHYVGSAYEFSVDVDLESSVWSASAQVGLVPADLSPWKDDAPGCFSIRCHGVTAWDQQGVDFGIPGYGKKMDRYRGRWRVVHGAVPEADLQWIEVRDLDAGGRLVYRRQERLARVLTEGRYVFGARIGYSGGDALLAHGFHPGVTRLALSNWKLKLAHPGSVPLRDPPTTAIEFAMEAGGRLLRGDDAGARDLYAKALERDVTLHPARVGLAVAGGDPAEFVRGFDIDPYGFLLVVDDAIRGAPAPVLRAVGVAARAALERHPGPALSLLGDFAGALPRLRGSDPATRYLRRRNQLVSSNEDWDWLVNRGMRTAGTELPTVAWAPGPGEGAESLRAALQGQLGLQEAWAIASRLLILDPGDRRMLEFRAVVALKSGRTGSAERDLRTLAELAPADPSGWLPLARFLGSHRATRETLEVLEKAVGAGMRAEALEEPTFAFLKGNARFEALKSR